MNVTYEPGHIAALSLPSESLIAQWLERLTGDQKVADSIPVWGSEIFLFAKA